MGRSRGKAGQQAGGGSLVHGSLATSTTSTSHIHLHQRNQVTGAGSQRKLTVATHTPVDTSRRAKNSGKTTFFREEALFPNTLSHCLHHTLNMHKHRSPASLSIPRSHFHEHTHTQSSLLVLEQQPQPSSLLQQPSSDRLPPASSALSHFQCHTQVRRCT